MERLVVAVGLGAGLLIFAGQADAQYRYTDDKGVTKTTQYKLDVPKDYRDAAVWVGPTGVGKPGLSKEAEETKRRDEAYRRIGEANAALFQYGKSDEAAKQSTKQGEWHGQPAEESSNRPGMKCEPWRDSLGGMHRRCTPIPGQYLNK